MRQYYTVKGTAGQEDGPPAVTGGYMDFGEMLGDAFTYTKEGVFGNRNRWLKLILAILCLGIPFNGYIMRVYRGAKPAPEVDQWETLFVDGLKLLVVGIVYAIPILVLWGLIYGTILLTGQSNIPDETAIAAMGVNLLMMMLMYIVEIIIAVLLPVAYIRFARTGTFSEAFNFSAIVYTIGRIGWINYIVALVLVSLVIGIPVIILIFGFILVAGATVLLLNAGFTGLLFFTGPGILLLIVLSPLFAVFQARYMTRVYDSALPASP